ncbi:Tubulin-specific chaperone E [Echinococcus granulosus]|uniref:Tubulin-specific chaperone E n=1 Tax=Echinococcus granulosus TaxID=6210 RepID=W6U2Z6_ECHGR|nr:Tubulin-specific chaperone E [Echinococcus granulosus]EUB55448.1 Tubulin-specific chaperone E [Echinococcus granulosus]KAH9285091.1 Tubulin-specific chaperone E [Echinococcus granulosus]
MVGALRNVPNLANIYFGTSTGRIQDVSQCLIGCRVVKDEQFGTIKYVGPIVSSSVVWLGIDWDNPKSGRHDGTFKGAKYFNTHHPTSGSFLKPEKASLGTSLEEALVTRYGMCAECQIIARNPALFQSGDDPVSGVKLETGASPGQLKATMDMSLFEAEFIGDGVSKPSAPFTVEIFASSSGELNNHQTCGAGGVIQKFSRLRVACVSGMPVYRGLRRNENLAEDVRTLWPGPGGQMSEYLGALRELDLSSCLISKWVEVASICSQLPALLKLNVGFNRLRLPPTAENELFGLPEVERRLLLDIDVDVAVAEELCSSAFPSLTRLAAVHMPAEKDGGTPFGWSEITRILGWMPSLKEVCIAYNEFGDLPDPSMGIGFCLAELLQKLTEVDLTGTGQSSFTLIFSTLGRSTRLTSLVLNVNRIREVHLPRDVVLFPSMTQLAIRDNLISDWKSVNAMAQLPSLTNLIISQNPIFASTTPETARQELIARLPRLKSLNRQEIERDERRGAELDFLKRYGKVWAETERQDEEARRAFKEEYPGFEQLCEKYGAPESGETKSVVHALKESLVELTITCEPPMAAMSPREVVKRLPARMTVNHLRSLVRRLFRLPTTAAIDLVTWGAQPGFDEVEVPLDSDTRELGFFGVVSGDRLVARWSPES